MKIWFFFGTSLVKMFGHNVMSLKVNKSVMLMINTVHLVETNQSSLKYNAIFYLRMFVVESADRWIFNF